MHPERRRSGCGEWQSTLFAVSFRPHRDRGSVTVRRTVYPEGSATFEGYGTAPAFVSATPCSGDKSARVLMQSFPSSVTHPLRADGSARRRRSEGAQRARLVHGRYIWRRLPATPHGDGGVHRRFVITARSFCQPPRYRPMGWPTTPISWGDWKARYAQKLSCARSVNVRCSTPFRTISSRGQISVPMPR